MEKHLYPMGLNVRLRAICGLLPLLCGLAAAAGFAARAEAGFTTWRVVAVLDGDTVKCVDDAKVEHVVGLRGIDAPELGQPFGAAARDRLVELTLQKLVRVAAGRRDARGRMTFMMTLDDNTNFPAKMLAEGLAWHTDDDNDDNTASRHKALAAAEREAREAKRGLWADPSPVPPWEWRLKENQRKRNGAAGLRVFAISDSFHAFVPGYLEQLVKAVELPGDKLVGRQVIGGGRPSSHWDLPDDKNKVKPALIAGEVDVLAVGSHAWLPDPATGKFAELGWKHNPDLRLYVQAAWRPAEVPSPKDKNDNTNAKRDDAKIADLQAGVDDWRTKLEAQADDLNRQHGKPAVFIVPVGDAVVKLRALIVAGKFPGVTRQSELFTDSLGHVGPHVQALAAYCNFAAIYRISPEGMEMPVKGIDAAQHAVLQKIAWETVSKYPHAGIGK